MNVLASPVAIAYSRDHSRSSVAPSARGAALRETRFAAGMLDSSRFDELAQSQRKTKIAALVTAGLVILVSLFANLGAIGLVGPDEPRYAWIARAMAETGDWVTPRLWGVPWFEKPVLYYWAAAIGFWLHLSRGVGCASAFRDCGARGGSRDRLVRLAPLWRRRRIVRKSGAARARNFFHQRRGDRIRARRDSRHAIQRGDHLGDGLRCKRLAASRRAARSERHVAEKSNTTIC